MRRLLISLLAGLATAALAASPAAAEFGISSYDVQIAANAPAEGDEAPLAPSGGAYHRAGGHPYAVLTHIDWNSHEIESGEAAGTVVPYGDIRMTEAELPTGLVGSPAPIPTCTAKQLVGADPDVTTFHSECPTDSQVGIAAVQAISEGELGQIVVPIFNMERPTGRAARFGFNVLKTPLYLDASTGPWRGYRIAVGSVAPQALNVIGVDLAFWGVPADPRHDGERCNAGAPDLDGSASRAECPGEPGSYTGPHSGGQLTAFLTMPTSCPADERKGEEWLLRTDSWEEPHAIHTAQAFHHLPPFAPDPSAPGAQQGMTECDRVAFNPDFAAQPTQRDAASASGVEIGLRFPSDGLLNPDGIAQSHLKKAVVNLPEGMTVNPSQAEGLGVCGPAGYEAASLDSYGCPSASKIGAVEVRTPLLEETIPGNVYVAKPYDNPFGSLLALYVVLREPQRGIVIKLPGKVEPDPRTGQITATFDDLPQLPFETFSFKFREGPRAPLITPSRCGTYTTEALFHPWARPAEAVPAHSSFQITSGPNGGPCPPQDVPPFNPDFSAGSLNNNAGSYSPFLMRLLRADGEQDMTKFSAVLPPGVSAKIAGVAKCPESGIQVAGEKTGTEERESPSCPARSEIGTILAGAGVGSTLVYIPGTVYLAGPYNGAPLSVVVITPAVAGPFDVGTVVVREALTLDPITAEVHVDGDKSDPIPHILAGIPLSVRDIRVSVDRPNFSLNPTSCDPAEVRATLFGSFLDVFSPDDDVPVSLSSRYQAANCRALGFKPRLSLKLKGGTKRGGHPALVGTYRPRAGQANLSRMVLRLPHSAFLDQAHIRTICTRAQFTADNCPKGAVYGKATAWTPLLSEPLSGPVYLRSSDNKLPDFVADLKGLVDVEAVARIDSKDGRIRATFPVVPDAPLTKVVVRMQGGKKGLIVNSRNLCSRFSRANVQFSGHNGKQATANPVIRADGCALRRKAQRSAHRAAAKRVSLARSNATG
jgi:hypothetical protein